MKATIWNAGVGKEINLRNEIGIEFTDVIPIITLSGFTIAGIGKYFCWWKKGDIAILVSREISNKMLHGYVPTGIIDAFPDKKDSTKLVYKFISLFDISNCEMPKLCK